MSSALAPPIQQLQLLLTERCNLRCTHCAVPEEDSPASFELTTQEWQRFVTEVLRSGVRRIVLSGGEALLRSDCLTIADHALSRGAEAVIIVTNGTTLPDRTVDRLSQLQRRRPELLLHVSVDGCDESTHDLIRGAGTFARTMAGLHRLRDGGGRVDGVHTVISRANIGDIDRIADLVKSVGATTWTVFPVAALGRGTELDSLRLSHSAWTDLLDRFASDPPADLDIGLMGPTVGDEWTDRFAVPQPRAEHSPQACVGPDGAVFTCPPLREVEAGSVNDVQHGTRWQMIERRLRTTLETACPRCKYRSLCTGIEPGAPPLAVPGGVGEPVIDQPNPVPVSFGRRTP
jgi:MoaA/NifB/PqqE/SkfB family radical SAM enzyme